MSLLEVTSLNVSVQVSGERRPIVRGVDLSVDSGEALGLVGESGSGKSMTLRSILRLLPSTATVAGSISFDGVEVLDLRGTALRRFLSDEVATVFQNPQASLNPLLRIGDFVCESLVANKGVSRQDAYKRGIDLLRDVGVTQPERRMNQRPHELSGGLLQRVMIASALIGEPRLLLADEPTTALDVTTQEEVMAILHEQRTERGLAMIFVTHDLDLATAVCDRIAVMYAGRIVEQARAGDLRSEAAHPYTRALLAARPVLEDDGGATGFETIAGRPVAAFEAPAGCAFNPRCAFATDICRVVAPVSRPTFAGRAECHHPQPPEQSTGNVTVSGRAS